MKRHSEHIGKEFLASCTRTDTGLTLTWAGSGQGEVPQRLAELLARVNQDAVEAAAREVVVDLRAVEFMSSSCIKSLVSWITEVLTAPPDRRYAIRFVPSDVYHWQRRSLSVLALLGTGVVTVDAA